MFGALLRAQLNPDRCDLHRPRILDIEDDTKGQTQPMRRSQIHYSLNCAYLPVSAYPW